MQIGCHVSISGSLANAVDNATSRNCTAFQLFTHNPRGWYAKDLDEQTVESFKTKLEQSGISNNAVCVHMPYLPNLASPEDAKFKKSLASLKDEIHRCSLLGIPYVVTHLGSHMGTGEEAGMNRLEKGLNTAAKETPDDVMILLENTAGQKNSVGADLKQLGELLLRCKPAKRFGVCFDTCHAFVAGYDMRTEQTVKETFEEFDKHIGLDRLRIIHLNDAKYELGSKRDRHYHIGLGKIGEKGLAEIIKTAVQKNIPLVLETPIDEERDDIGNMEKARELFATV